MDELPSIHEIAATLIEACDSLNFHNLEALDRRERQALIEALPYLRSAINLIEAPAQQTKLSHIHTIFHTPKP